MPFEFDPNAADDTVSSNTVSAFRKSPQRISRRSSFAVSPKQRDWIMVQLRALQANVTHDAFQDHALLLQIIIRGTRSPPASSVIDSNERAIRAMVQGDRADFECRTNQLYRIRFLMLAYPHKQWIRTPPSPQTQGKPHCRPSTCAPHSSFVRRTSPKPTPRKTNYPKAAYRPPSPSDPQKGCPSDTPSGIHWCSRASLINCAADPTRSWTLFQACTAGPTSASSPYQPVHHYAPLCFGGATVRAHHRLSLSVLIHKFTLMVK